MLGHVMPLPHPPPSPPCRHQRVRRGGRPRAPVPGRHLREHGGLLPLPLLARLRGPGPAPPLRAPDSPEPGSSVALGERRWGCSPPAMLLRDPAARRRVPGAVAASEPFAPSPPKRTTPLPPFSWLRPPGLSSQPLYPHPHRQPLLLPQQSPPRPGPPPHPPPCHAPRGLAGRLPQPRSPSSSPHPAETGFASPRRASLLH